MSGLSIVIATGETGADVRSCLESWAAAGMLRDVIWVRAVDIASDGAGPARVNARLTTAEGSVSGDLFELVGVRRIDLLRLVAVQLVTHAVEPEAGFIDAARLLAELLSASIPHSTGDDQKGTQLSRVNLIIGESGVNSLSRQNLIPDWELNAIVAAEDRPDLDRGSVYVRHPGNFVGHAAAAIASVAALWGDVTGGALDTVPIDSTLSDGDLLVLRTSVRAVIGDDPADTVGREAMSLAVEDLNGPAPLLDWARTSTDASALSRRAAEHVLGGDDWQVATPIVPSRPRQRVRGISGALGDAVRFNLQMFRFVASFLARSGRRAVENAATDALVGRDSDTLVRYGPQTAESMREVAQRLIDAEGERFLRSSKDMGTQSIPGPRPQTWQDLRAMCFGLADGGPLPVNFAPPERAGLRELAPPRAVAPEPGPGPEVGQHGAPLRDPLAARAAYSELSAHYAQLVAEDAEDREGLAAMEENPQQQVRHLEADALRLSLQELETWIDRQRQSTTWLVAESLADRLERLEAVQADTREPAMPPHNDRLRRAEKGLKVWWTLSVVTLLAGAVAAVLQFLSEDSATLEHYRLPLVLAVVAVLVAVIANHRYYRELRRYEWATDNALAHWRWEQETQMTARREFSRLGLLYEALVDWSEIIGHLVHRPWATTHARSNEVPDDVVAALPASVAVAAARTESEPLRRAAMQAVPIICPSGWITEQFDRLVDAQARNMPNDSGYLPADLDTTRGPLSPRQQLLEACRSGESARIASDRAISRIREAVADRELELPGRVVQRIGRFGDGEAISDAEFFETSLGSATPYSVDQWTPTGLVRARHIPQKSIAWVPRVDRVPPGMDVRETAGSVAVRVDISRRAAPSDLVLFRTTESSEWAGPLEVDAGDW